MRYLYQCMACACVSGTRSKNCLPRHHLPAGPENWCSLGKRAASWPHVGAWHDASGSRSLGHCLGSLLCRPEHNAAEHQIAAPHRAGQHLFQGCSIGPVMCFSVWGGTKATKMECGTTFCYGLAIILMLIWVVGIATLPFSSQVPNLSWWICFDRYQKNGTKASDIAELSKDAFIVLLVSW